MRHDKRCVQDRETLVVIQAVCKRERCKAQFQLYARGINISYKKDAVCKKDFHIR